MIFIYIFIIRECDYIVVGIYWNRFYVFLYLYSCGFGFLLVYKVFYFNVKEKKWLKYILRLFKVGDMSYVWCSFLI